VLRFIRIWLPVIVTFAGVAVMVIGGGDDVSLEGGAGIIGAGLAIWLMNVLFRVGLDNDRDRDAEDAARDFLDEHGYWPDDTAGPGGAPAPVASAECPPTGSRPAGAPRRAGADRGAMRPRRPG
jgi:hypothetical protein